MNPFLALLALASGFFFSWFFIVTRRVVRQVDEPALWDGGVQGEPDGEEATDHVEVDDEATSKVTPVAVEVQATRDDPAAEDIVEPGFGAEEATDDFSMRPEPETNATGDETGTPAHETRDDAPSIDDSPEPSEPEGIIEEALAETDTIDAPGQAQELPSEVGDAVQPETTSTQDAPASRWTPRGTEPSEDTKPLVGTDKPVQDRPIMPASTAPKPDLPAMVPAPKDGGTPDGYTVKGDSIAVMYITADDPDFERARPDVWFIDEAAALKAGYVQFRRPAK